MKVLSHQFQDNVKKHSQKSKYNEKRSSTGKFASVKFLSDKRKKEIETERFQKASMLRKYAKLCKSEGIQSDRVNLGNDRTAVKLKDKTKFEREPPQPFSKAIEDAAKLRSDKSVEIKKRESEMKSQDEKQKQRRERSRLLSQKTKKGQPVMKNRITSLLDKIMKSN